MGSHETVDGGPLPINMEHLSQYTANDPSITRDVLALFRCQAGDWLDALHAAPDLGAWRAAAHKMKGGSRGVGAEELAELAEEAESLDALDGAGQVDLLARLDHATARATRYAAQLLEDSPFVG